MQEDQKTNENEEEKTIEEELNFEKANFVFVPGIHRYRQQGYYLVCTECPLVHATWIGKDRVMVGEDEKGNPILKMRKEVGLV
jgi:hypothetical protein